MEKTYSYEGRCYTTEFANKEMWNFYLSSSEEFLDLTLTKLKNKISVAKVCDAHVIDEKLWEVTVVVEDKDFIEFKNFLELELDFRFI